MKTKKKRRYIKPEFTLYRTCMEQPLLVMSSNEVKLKGAGVDESDADDNGNEIWP